MTVDFADIRPRGEPIVVAGAGPLATVGLSHIMKMMQESIGPVLPGRHRAPLMLEESINRDIADIRASITSMSEPTVSSAEFVASMEKQLRGLVSGLFQTAGVANHKLDSWRPVGVMIRSHASGADVIYFGEDGRFQRVRGRSYGGRRAARVALKKRPIDFRTVICTSIVYDHPVPVTTYTLDITF